MPIYSEIVKDDEILESMGNNVSSVLIIGCGGCTNESISFKNKTPIYAMNKKNPYSVTSEIIRIAKLLQKNGYEVKWHVFPEEHLLCMANIDKSYNLAIKNRAFDVILALCCPAGKYGLKKIVENEITIIQITKQIGILYYVFNEDENKKEMIYDKSLVIFDVN